jgi:hypothetical protein
MLPAAGRLLVSRRPPGLAGALPQLGLVQVRAAKSSTDASVNEPSMPCHQRRSQWEHV